MKIQPEGCRIEIWRKSNETNPAKADMHVFPHVYCAGERLHFLGFKNALDFGMSLLELNVDLQPNCARAIKPQ